MRAFVAGVLAFLPVVASATPVLRFVRHGSEIRRLDLKALRAACQVTPVPVDDPYYEARKTFVTCPMTEVLDAGFGPDVRGDVLLRCLDGYAKPTTIARLREAGAHLAFADETRPEGFALMGAKRIDPGPFYLVWTKPAQRDTHRYPWPYQLASIELVDLASHYPHIVPTTAPEGSPAWKGYDVFRSECVSCHAINREGGTVGPDLNVPQSIVEYRPAIQVKQYIRNPAAFRYGNMPSHEHLTDADLDALIAYFDAMRGLKYDPNPRAP